MAQAKPSVTINPVKLPTAQSVAPAQSIQPETTGETIAQTTIVSPVVQSVVHSVADQPAPDTIVLFDTNLMQGLNTVRFSIQVPFTVKTQDGETLSFEEVSLVPGLQLVPVETWNKIVETKAPIVVQMLELGAIRVYMNSANDFNAYQPWQANEAIKFCIDEKSLPLLQVWANGSLSQQNQSVRDRLSQQITDLTGADNFTQARQMMPQFTV